MSERQFYTIQAKADDVAEVWIYDQIGESFWSEGVTAKQFVKDLVAIKAQRIDLHINSPGGSVFDGVAIFNALRNHPAKVTTFIDGIAASIASIIALAGDQVTMAGNALYMIHNPWGFAQGDSAEMRKMADMLDKVRETLLVTYREKTGKDDEELTALLDAETWMTADEALAHGFIDEVTGEVKMAALFDLKAFGYQRAPEPIQPVAVVATDINQAPKAEIKENTVMSDPIVAPAGAEPKVDVIQNQAADIVELCHAHGCSEQAAGYIKAGLTADQVARKLLAGKATTVVAAAPAAERADLSQGIDAKTLRNYKLFRALNAVATGDWSKAGLELECSRHIANTSKRDPRGFFMPVLALTSGGAGTGAELVGTDHMANLFIDALRAQSIIGRLGAQFLEGLVGDVAIPKLATGTTFYWVAEDGTPTQTPATTGSVAMNPHTAGGSVPISRKLLKQSSPSVEALIRNDLLRGAALIVEQAALQGTGADNQPTGIVNTSGVNTSTISAAGNPDWDEIVLMETEVATDNALAGQLGYLVAPSVRGAMKVKPRFTSTGLPIWADNNTVNGYMADASSLMPANGIIFGDWASLLIGFWGAIDLSVDTATKVADGGLVLRAFVDADVAVRHAQSFCINA